MSAMSLKLVSKAPVLGQTNKNPYDWALSGIGPKGLELIGSTKKIPDSMLQAIEKVNLSLTSYSPTHKDDRRIITAIPENDGEIVKIQTIAQCRLGDHYHPEKKEVLAVVKSQEPVVMAQVSYTADKDEMITKKMEAGEATCMHPGTVHTFIAPEDATLLLFTDRKFKHGDTVPVKLSTSLS